MDSDFKLSNFTKKSFSFLTKKKKRKRIKYCKIMETGN